MIRGSPYGDGGGWKILLWKLFQVFSMLTLGFLHLVYVKIFFENAQIFIFCWMYKILLFGYIFAQKIWIFCELLFVWKFFLEHKFFLLFIYAKSLFLVDAKIFFIHTWIFIFCLREYFFQFNFHFSIVSRKILTMDFFAFYTIFLELFHDKVSIVLRVH